MYGWTIKGLMGGGGGEGNEIQLFRHPELLNAAVLGRKEWNAGSLQKETKPLTKKSKGRGKWTFQSSVQNFQNSKHTRDEHTDYPLSTFAPLLLGTVYIECFTEHKSS